MPKKDKKKPIQQSSSGGNYEVDQDKDRNTQEDEFKDPEQARDPFNESEESLYSESPLYPRQGTEDDDINDSELAVFKRYLALGTELSGVGARLPNPLDYDIRKMMKVWNIQNSASDDVLLGIIARLSTYEEIQKATAVGNSNYRVPYLTFYLDGNGSPALPPAGTDESNYQGKVYIDDMAKLLTLDKSIYDRYTDVFIAYDKSPFWIHCLTACFQTKALSDTSISNFFKSVETACPDIRTLATTLKFAKGVLPVFMRYKEFRKIFRRVPFMVYHTSACSTPTILANMLDDLGELVPCFFTRTEVESIYRANSNYWDLQLSKAIPTNCVAMAHTYLAVNGKSIPNWHQGNKAANDVSMGLKNKWTQLFLKFKELSEKKVDVTNVKTMKQLEEYITDM